MFWTMQLTILAIGVVAWFVMRGLDQARERRGFNSTADWTPGPGGGEPAPKDPMDLAEWFERIRQDQIAFLAPPKQGIWGSSGTMRPGLMDGHEYQVGFLGPLLNPKMMKSERRLTAYLRSLAPRFPPARPDNFPRLNQAA